MKLLFVSNLFPDTREPYRGLDNACLLHELARECEVRVVSPRPALPLGRSPAPRICRPADAPLKPLYIDASYVPKLGSLFNHRLFAGAMRRPLRELRKKYPFDVVLVSWLFPDAVAIGRLADELGVPFVAICQGSDAHLYLQMPLRKRVIVASLERASGVITRSARLAELLRDAGVAPQKLHPIYNGVDLDRFHPGDREQARRALGLKPMRMLLFVGNFLPVKNPLLLVQAHADLCKRFPNLECQLVMVGSGPMEADIRRKAEECNSRELLVIAGKKTPDEVAEYMRAADALCLSSRNEGVPNVILEAFATGLPVVSTDVGGIREVMTEQFLGELIKGADERKFADAVARVLMRERGSEAIARYASRFSWTRTAAAYLDLLKETAHTR